MTVDACRECGHSQKQHDAGGACEMEPGGTICGCVGFRHGEAAEA